VEITSSNFQPKIKNQKFWTEGNHCGAVAFAAPTAAQWHGFSGQNFSNTTLSSVAGLRNCYIIMKLTTPLASTSTN
jgi:hypothetical protein